MRVAQVHWEYFPTCGGVESHLETVSEVLRDATWCSENAVIHGTIDSGGHSTRHGTPMVYSRALDLHRVVTEDDLDELIAVLATYDVVHFHNLHYFDTKRGESLLPKLESGPPGKRFHTVHETWLSGQSQRILEWSGWCAQFAISNYILASLGRSIRGRFATDVLTYPPTQAFADVPATSAAREHLSLPREAFIFLHPARMLPWKGTADVVRALRQVVRAMPNALLVITDTPRVLDWSGEVAGYRERIVQDIIAHGLSSNVLIRQFERASIPTLFAAADVIVYPTSGEEPFGLVPVEAIHARKVPIVSASGGLLETVSHEKNGLVVPPGVAERLAEAMLQLGMDPALRDTLVAGGEAIRLRQDSGALAAQLRNYYMEAR